MKNEIKREMMKSINAIPCARVQVVPVLTDVADGGKDRPTRGSRFLGEGAPSR